jgi:hypothetical protein
VELIRLAGDCLNNDCPAVYATDRGTIAVQGVLVTDPGSARLAPGEALVEISVDLLREAARAVG